MAEAKEKDVIFGSIRSSNRTSDETQSMKSSNSLAGWNIWPTHTCLKTVMRLLRGMGKGVSVLMNCHPIAAESVVFQAVT